MFEAIHGSAPDIAGKGIANPSGLLNAAVMMLVHLGQPEVADKIQNAWLLTLEEGYHTADIFKVGLSKKLVNTFEFSEEIIKRLGKKPENIFHANFSDAEKKTISVKIKDTVKQKKELVGVDVFLHWDSDNRNPDTLGDLLNSIDTGNLQLKLITNRGVKVYPNGIPETYCTDHWRCRFVSKHLEEINGKVKKLKEISPSDILNLLNSLTSNNIEFIKIENLYLFDGEKGFSLGQGE